MESSLWRTRDARCAPLDSSDAASNAAGAFERLLGLGATVHQPLIDREEGWRNAIVVDPFGTLPGSIQSSHWASKH